jgi:hypothetical protein
MMLCLVGFVPNAEAQEYDLSFTLPTAGKSGCMVCHADPNLVRIQGDRYITYWVDSEPLDAGPHAGIMCTACHLDFAYKAPHGTDDGQWRRTAKLSCRNCHQEQWNAYNAGVHSLAAGPGESAQPGDEDKPLCGDCHGSHEIAMLTDNPAGVAELHRRGYEVCGRCHEEYWDSYADYYHGAAYRRGAPDAPACWQCHGYHDIAPSDERRSSVNENSLAKTCGECHTDVNDVYLSYSSLVHKRAEVVEANRLATFIGQVRERMQSLLIRVGIGRS